jgi:class 3 adenylate cyclase
VESQGVEKIKSFGDVYLCVSGLTSKSEVSSAEDMDDIIGQRYTNRMIQTAVQMMSTVTSMNATNEAKLNVRIILSKGTVYAAVLGSERLTFDCFGEAVDIAKHLDRYTPENFVHVTEQFRRSVPNRYEFEENTTLEVPNYGTILTYFLKQESSTPTYNMIPNGVSPNNTFTEEYQVSDNMNREIQDTMTISQEPQLEYATKPQQLETDTCASVTSENNSQVVFVAAAQEDDTTSTEEYTFPEQEALSTCYRPYKKILKRLMYAPPIQAFVHPKTNKDFFEYWHNRCITHIRVGLVMMLMVYFIVILSELMMIARIGKSVALILQYLIFLAQFLASVVYFTPLGRRSIVGLITVVFTYVLYVLFPFTMYIEKSLISYISTFVLLITMVVGFFAVMPLVIKGLLCLGVILVTWIVTTIVTGKGNAFDFLFDFAAIALPCMAHAFMMKYLAPALVMEKSIHVDTQVIKRERKRNAQWILSNIPKFLCDKLCDPQFKYHESMKGSVCFLSMNGLEAQFLKNGQKAISIVNEVYADLDVLTEGINCRKVNSAGGVYLVVSNHEKNAEYIAKFAIAARKIVNNALIRHDVPANLMNVTMGIHTGEFIAGIIGHIKCNFDVYGETVSKTYQLMLSSTPGNIHLDKEMFNALKDRFDISSCNDITTFYLNNIRQEPIVLPQTRRLSGFGDSLYGSPTRRRTDSVNSTNSIHHLPPVSPTKVILNNYYAS